MSRKRVLSAFISFFILTVLVSQILSSQSLANKKCVIPQSGTVNYPNARVDLTLAETVHNLDTGLSYTTIQAAIDAVETLDGHTIFVEEGTYYEHLYINKSLTLFGDTIGTAVIDGNGTSQVVDIKADNVDISNFLITNGQTGFYIRDSSHNRIWQNTITNTVKAITVYGYVLSHSSFNTISENTISNNTCGIDDGGVNTTIAGNTVTFNEQGIAGGANTTIVGNTVASNEEGMYLGTNNTVISNTVKNNFLGVVIGTGSKLRGNKLDENRFNFVASWLNLRPRVAHNDIDTTNKINGKNIHYIMNQTNLLIDSSTNPNISYLALIQCQNVTVKDLTLSSNGEGIMLSDCINCTIQNCHFKSNIVGITATASNTCLIDNNIIDNLQGIKLTGDHNKVTNNNIINNTIRSLPYTYPDKWPNRWASTYFRFLIDLTTGAASDFPLWSGGLYLQKAENCTISSNNIAHNEHGILLFCSRYNVLKNNSMTGNVYNFGIRRPYVPIEWARNPPDHPQISPYLMHSIDSSNTVDGKPICYWIDRHHQIVPSDAGYVALINCTDIVAQNLVLTHNYRGVLLVATRNILLSHSVISGTKFGIEITDQGVHDFPASVNNTIQENSITNSGTGIYLSTSNNSVCNNLLTSNLLAIVVDKDFNEIIGNIMTNNVQPPIEEWLLGFYPPHENDISWRWRYPYHGSAYGGIILETSNTFVHRNEFTSNDFGLALEPYYWNTQANVVTANIFVNNEYGIWLEARDNMFYHNNFVNNAYSVYIDPGLKGRIDPNALVNTWDNGVEGNYWSDYTGHDSDNNGIGDSAYYDIGWANQDNHPLMGQFFSFNTSLGKHVNVISNSTIEDFEYFESNSTIRMYVSGESAYGFCRACIPHELMKVTSISVIIDDGATTTLYPNYTLHDNTTHSWIYFAYQHSTHKIDIIPEFLSLILLPLFMIATLLTVVVYKRKHQTWNKKREV